MMMKLTTSLSVLAMLAVADNHDSHTQYRRCVAPEGKFSSTIAGSVALYQECNSDEDEPTMIRLSWKNLQPFAHYGVRLYEGVDGVASCLDAATPIYDLGWFEGDVNGRGSAWNLSDEFSVGLEGEGSIDGLYATIVDRNGERLACCQITA